MHIQRRNQQVNRGQIKLTYSGTRARMGFPKNENELQRLPKATINDTVFFVDQYMLQLCHNVWRCELS